MPYTSLTLLGLLDLAGGARAQANLPPVARVEVAPIEVVVGADVELSGSASFDPDEGPMPLSFSWSFDDAATAEGPEVVHAFDRAGAFRVRLVVDDGAARTEAGATVFVLEPPAEGRAVSSGPLVLDDLERTLWVVNPDSGSVSELDTTNLEVRREIPICDSPANLAIGATLAITCPDEGLIVAVDPATGAIVGQLRDLPRPHGIAVTPLGEIAVVDETGVFAIVDRALVVRASIELGGDLRALAIDPAGATAYTGRFLSRGEVDHGTLFRVAIGGELRATEIELPIDPGPDSPSSGRGVPNLLGALAVEPSGRAIRIGGLKSNTGRGLARDGLALGPENRVRGFFGRVGESDLLDDLSRRIDTNNADSASAIALSPNGRFAYVAHQGIGAVSVYDLASATFFAPGRGSTVPFEARIEVGDAPRGIAVTRDGRRAYVASLLSRAVAVLDLSDPAAPALTAMVTVTREALGPSEANGKRMFFRSTDPVHSRGGYIACASCHPDGGHDGRTWDFTQAGEGLRNTIDLRGRGGDAHGPVHWSANFDEIQDFENDIVHGFGGTGLAMDGAPPNPPLGTPNAGRGRDLDDLAAWLRTLTSAPESPFAGGAIERGRALFEDPRVGCADCHVPPRFTDSVLTEDRALFVLHDVGTIGALSGERLGGPLAGLDTPTLLGVWASPPYLHDGSAATLRDVLVTRNPSDRHGRTSHLSESEIGDLVAYLQSLDEAPTDPAGGCACNATESRVRESAFLLLVLASLHRRARSGTSARRRNTSTLS